MSQVPSNSASSTSFEAIFNGALEEYEKKTKKDIASHPLAAQLKSCDSPSAILAVLRAQVQAPDKSQSADERLTKWLDPTVNVLSAFSAILGDAAGLVFPPSSAVFAGIGILLQAVKDVRASQGAIISLFSRIEYFFLRLEKYIKVRPTVAMRDIIVQIMAEVLSILGIVTKEIGQGTMKKFFKKLVGRKDVEDALQRLDQLTQEEARMAAAEALVITRGIDDNVKGVDEKLQVVDMKVDGVDIKIGSVIKGVKDTGVAIQEVVNQFGHLNRNELRKDLRKWIAPPDPSVNLKTASGAHHEGTAVWCTKGSTVAIWRKSGSLLWIHGKPGSGKSILSSVIIRDIKSMSNAGSAFLAYFYFDFKDTEKQDLRALLSSLLVQLSDQSDIFFDTLFSLYSAHKKAAETPTDDSLAECLKDMLTIAGRVPIYLVIDALDECPNDTGIPSSRERVLELVKELVELRHPNLRLCITSRPEFDIHTMLKPLATQQMSLHDESGQKQDIIDYVTSVLHSDKKMKRWRDVDKKMIIEKLSEKADGMFRWVYCQLEVLRHCFPTNLRRTLEELPKSLDDTYKRILKEINNANREHAYRLLQCLAVASRPLRVEELAEVLAFDFTGGIPKSVSDWRWEDREEAVLSACSSLISVISNADSRIVQFSHFSVKEFLTSERLAGCMEDFSRFHIPMEPSHVILAKACLGVLLRLGDGTDADSALEIPLFRYAAEYWHQHAQIGNVELEIVDAIDCFFDTDKPHFSAWVRIRGRGSFGKSHFSSPNPAPRLVAPLSFAAGKGFRALVERLTIKHPYQVNQFDSIFGTPLHASAIWGRDIEIAHFLRKHGADIDSPTTYNWTPLHLASRFGHLQIGKWLLDCGANVNSRTKDGWTSLSLAAANGHLEVCQMLLDHNAEVNPRHENGSTVSTPLIFSLQRVKPDIAWLLLDHGADVRVCDKSGKTPLHFAAAYDHIEVVRMLLEHNVVVNSQDDQGSTPLLFASQKGNLNPHVLQLLLDHGADAHVHDLGGKTLLHLAAANGHYEVVQILLGRNAEVNSRDYNGSTPLLLASYKGKHNVVRLLLDHKADAQVCDYSRRSLLHLATANGHLEVAQILLACNVDVNSQDDCGDTPLLLASKNGKPDVVQLLLDHDADEQVVNNGRETPLQFAAAGGHLEVARILLKRNTEVDSQDYEGFTPLLHVSSSQNEEPDVAQLLLDHGADACICNKSGDTPLHLTAARGHLKVAQILLSCSAEINSQNNEGSTPLLLALKNEELDAAQLLLDHGADPHICNNCGQTPLHLAAYWGHLEVAQILLDRNAAVNFRDNLGVTPLLSALQNGKPDVARLLLDRGADFTAHMHNNSSLVQNNSGNLLHLAAAKGYLDIAQILLDRNAEVNYPCNYRDDQRSTPLLLALEERKSDVAQLLLDRGADAQVRSKISGKSGQTPLHLAATDGHLEVAQILLDRNVEVNSRDDYGSTPLLLASGNGKHNIVRLLLNHDADAQAHDNRGETPLHMAAHSGHLEIASILLEHGVEVDSRNTYGASPFVRASVSGKHDVVRLLLDHKADAHVRDSSGSTSLHHAASNGHLEAARILLELNAGINSRNKRGYTPLLLASQNGHTALLQLLLEHGADVHARDRHGDTALHHAARGRTLETVSILLGLDVEINSRNVEGRTPLHQATSKYQVSEMDFEVMRLLLNHGAADLQARDNNGKIASEVAHSSNREKIVQLFSQYAPG